ncbi:protein RMD5 homolog [Mercurialis annua]|uniref:protein RMD5 homolog n=1 Tax=Mercurialis annua TaxID=3986 RepID=UPI00215EBF65|nr:protein RMD5 homolog [Mercurialis annua]
MELSTVRDAFDRVVKKQKLSSSKSQEVIDQISHVVEQALSKLESIGGSISLVDQKSILIELKEKLSAMCTVDQLEGSQKELKYSKLFEGSQKELNFELSKYLKILEKSFNPDISRTYINDDFDFHLVNQILGCHFYRLGHFDVGDCLISEAGEPEAAVLRSQFLELHQILNAIKVKNLDPALKWVSSNREKLEKICSNLELKIHCLQFLEILKGGNRVDALKYSKTHLSPFASHHMKELQRVTVSVLWTRKLENYPHSELLSPIHWENLSEELTRDFCNLIGQSCGSLFSLVIAAGFDGLPTLLKLAEVMSIKKQEWQAMKQLPVPVELGREFHFHSAFVCPVSREQSSDENPPMLMPCQHVLCKQSITKMSKGTSQRFKCPYCPAEATVAQCRQLHL